MKQFRWIKGARASPNISVHGLGTDKVLGRGRPSLVLTQVLRARLLKRPCAVRELCR